MTYHVELSVTDMEGRTVTYAVKELQLPTEPGKGTVLTTAATSGSMAGEGDWQSVRAEVKITATVR
jgi:hypothetical protein